MNILPERDFMNGSEICHKTRSDYFKTIADSEMKLQLEALEKRRDFIEHRIDEVNKRYMKIYYDLLDQYPEYFQNVKVDYRDTLIE